MALLSPSRLILRCALAAAALGASAHTMAAPVGLLGPMGEVKVGNTATFTVFDQSPLDGYSAINDAYAADFSLSYDKTVLQYLGVQSTSPDFFVIAPDLSAGEPDPDGTVRAQVLIGGTPLNAPLALFTISFKALVAASGAGTGVTISFPDGGAYGDVDTATTTPFSAATTRTTISAVPEVQAWALALAGGLVAVAVGRRRTAR